MANPRTIHRPSDWRQIPGARLVRVNADGIEHWTTLPTPPTTRAAGRDHHSNAVTRQPSRSGVYAPIPTVSEETRQVLRRHVYGTNRPTGEECTRVFQRVDAATVPAGVRMIAEHAVNHALRVHGVPPDAVRIQWVQQLAPGASKMAADELYGHAHALGWTRPDAGDGRQPTIFLRRDLTVEAAAETGLHEGFHAVQYLTAPLAMRDAAMRQQAEQQALAFGKTHLSALGGLLGSLQPRQG